MSKYCYTGVILFSYRTQRSLIIESKTYFCPNLIILSQKLILFTSLIIESKTYFCPNLIILSEKRCVKVKENNS